MSNRRDNRIAAFQFLYMWDINPPEDIEVELKQFFDDQENPREFYDFAEELIHGTIENRDEIDSEINSYAQNWSFRRIAKVDLAILRLAIYELLYRTDIPPVVSINEAIDLTKVFSIPDARRFINGILDQLKAKLNRPSREPVID
jgi:N utilization substance protein B